MTTESAEATALFRYRVVAEALGLRLSPAERGWIVRDSDDDDASSRKAVRLELLEESFRRRGGCGRCAICWRRSGRG